ncbi:hypothetical protein J2X32_000881 [Rheinheimera pacifica]|uniref:hypothetical protein n=1 Tax=Rheinheimera pacifica TaxID=173990 RepID=UPI00285CC414|nr:hypothetical protein [Rheinheimera pacifica]MDR6982273.1 hypothetical protein [Rheinheimera pacifica]
MYKIIGGVLGMFGIAVMTYFNLVSSTATNPRCALIGALIFAIGLGIIMVNRFKVKSDKNGKA